jgi:hypothetical protein
MSTGIKSELLIRMQAMKHAGLIPDEAVADDAVWRRLYNDNLSVRLAYDQDKYGKSPPLVPPQALVKSFKREDTPEATITERSPLMAEFKRIADAEAPPKERKPMDRALLIATARGHAATFKDKDDYFAWLLNELADALEAAPAPNGTSRPS